MNPKDLTVVRITNISNFDFTGELGARYGGIDYPLRAGASKLMPFGVADHLATHLARQIMLTDAPTRDDNHEDGRGGESKRSDRKLWDEAGVEELKKRIITEGYDEEMVAPKSEAEVMKARIDAMNKDFPYASTTPESSTTSAVYQDKAEVIAELNKRGIKFDARSNKEKLEELLK